ncbi:hypothetical protein LXL04_008637 [Taraxacum kok-saghyz]
MRDDKLSSKSTPCLFLGYASNYKGYICFDPITSKVHHNRNVIFHETTFPSTDILPSNQTSTTLVQVSVPIPSEIFSHPSVSPFLSSVSSPSPPSLPSPSPSSSSSPSPPPPPPPSPSAVSTHHMTTSKSYKSLVSSFALEGEIDQAVSYLWEMIGNQRLDDYITYWIVLDEFCRQQLCGDAVNLLNKLEEKCLVDLCMCNKLEYELQAGYRNLYDRNLQHRSR